MRLRVLTLLLLLPALLHAQKVKPAPPVPYTSFENEHLTLYAWPGSKTAVLTASPTLQPETMQKLLSATDRAYQFFADQTGRLPAPGPNYKGVATIAEVAKTCGPGCANLGSTGIEITPQSMLFLYFGIRNVNRYDQVVFYELGRNFWFLNSQLNYKESINEPCINTGFAVLMRDQGPPRPPPPGRPPRLRRRLRRAASPHRNTSSTATSPTPPSPGPTPSAPANRPI